MSYSIQIVNKLKLLFLTESPRSNFFSFLFQIRCAPATNNFTIDGHGFKNFTHALHACFNSLSEYSSLVTPLTICDRLWENPAYGIFCENRV